MIEIKEFAIYAGLTGLWCVDRQQ